MQKPGLPVDRCPYPRPFAPDFADCPAYQATTFVATDSRNNALGAWHTCRHLTSGNSPTQTGWFYPRCSLGSAEQRLRWVSEVTPPALDVVRALQEEFDLISLPHREKLLQARASADNPVFRPDPELEQEINDFLLVIDGFLAKNEGRFRDVGLPIEPLRRLAREWIWAWARTPEFGTTRVSDASIRSLSMAARAFIGAPVEPRPIPIRRLWDEPVYNDAILRIVPTVEPNGLALIGDVDVSNLAAVSDAVTVLRSRPGDVHLDLTDLLFCDLGGLQAIVHAARSMPDGRRLVLHGIPRRVERALEMFEWTPLPTLILERVPSDG